MPQSLSQSNISFVKYHGLGNDFIILDLRHQDWRPDEHWLRFFANRHTGIGFDQALIIHDVDDASGAYVVGYQVANADGSYVGQCGNGARCVADWLLRKGDWQPNGPLGLKTVSQCMWVKALESQNYSVNMGLVQPGIDLEGTLSSLKSLKTPYGEFAAQCWFIGNPHIVIKVTDVADAPVAEVGAWCQQAEQLFPQGVNVGFVQHVDEGQISLRVFERGADETACCASGACCAVVAANHWQWVAKRAQAKMKNGSLTISLDKISGEVTQVGPAQYVFSGEVPKSAAR